MNKLTLIGLTGLTALLTGCSTYPKRDYTINNLKLTCDDEEKINDAYELFAGRRGVAGFQVPNHIYVRWSEDLDKNGEPLPDFETLGHEVWHHIKGSYHK